MNIVACEPTTVAEFKAAHVARRVRLGLIPAPVPYPKDGCPPRPFKVHVCIRRATPEELSGLSRECAAIRAANGWPAQAYRGVVSAKFPMVLSARGQITREVLLKHELTWTSVISARRHSQLVRARQELMWRLQRETTMSLPQIGRFIGGRDHTTVLHGARQHQKRVDAKATPDAP